MTIILSCLTDRFIVQVSDMRLTWPDGSVFDDRAAKTTLLCGRHLLAYTGIACAGGDRTDLWSAYAAAKGTSIEESIDHVKAEAERRLSNVHPTVRKLVFVTAGWARRDPGDALHPMYVEISNLEARDWSRPALGAFTDVGSMLLRRRVFRWAAVGQPLTRAEGIWLNRGLRRRVRVGAGPQEVALLLVIAARAMAARNRLVGSSLIVSSLPRDTVPADADDLFAETREVDWGRPAFLYVPSAVDERITFMPNVACEGMAYNSGAIFAESDVPPPIRECPPAP